MTNEAPRPKLPHGLPKRGVLVLQFTSGPFFEKDPDTDRRKPLDATAARAEFEKYMTKAYKRCGVEPDEKPYQDPAGRSPAENDLQVQAIKISAQERAVLVHLFPNEGRRDDLERLLVQLMNKEGIVVSLIGATGPKTAEADLHRLSQDGTPLKEHYHIDLTPCLEQSGTKRRWSAAAFRSSRR